MVTHFLIGLLAFCISCACCFVVIACSNRWRLGLDSPDRARRLHLRHVPRLGGVPMGLAFSISMLSMSFVNEGLHRVAIFLMIILLPTFLAGVAEDLTGKIGIRLRLLATGVSAVLAAWLLGAILTRIDLPFIDPLLAHHIGLAMAVTLIALAGIPHAMNIVDGCNGLATSAAVTALIGLYIISWHVGDAFVACAALIAICTAFGFLLWNFPLGYIFLGDGGAYTVGLLIAVLSILLVVHHPKVSAWFPLLLVIHPVLEVLVSSVRRSRRGLGQIMHPDAGHLHQLVYRCISSRLLGNRSYTRQALASSMTSLMFSFWHVAGMVLAIVFWSQTRVLMFCVAGFAVLYFVNYWLLSRFDLGRFRQGLHQAAEGSTSVPDTSRAATSECGSKPV